MYGSYSCVFIKKKIKRFYQKKFIEDIFHSRYFHYYYTIHCIIMSKICQLMKVYALNINIKRQFFIKKFNIFEIMFISELNLSIKYCFIIVYRIGHLLFIIY